MNMFRHRLPTWSIVCALLLCSLSMLGVAATAAAQEAWPPKIKRVLPPVVAPLSDADLAKVKEALAEIDAALTNVPADEDDALPLRPDVEIFRKAIDLAIRHNEFFKPEADLKRVEALKKAALERAASLAKKETPWTEAHGVVVRGYRSVLDDSVQPYGLVIPEKLDLAQPVPLYVWLHGRGDTQCDLQFIAGFLGTKAPGPLLPENAIVLHPFGRYCNGFKSAGEVDVLEAIEDVKTKYVIDEDRIVMAGFSMGGAGAWHLGAHYPGMWCAVHAGAGFVDVRRYQNITADKLPPSYEQTLWGLYDVPDYRRNLLNNPLIAYSGADDKQKAAADIMEQELAKEGLKLTHIIGPGVGHKYEAKALADVQSRLQAIVEKGIDRSPQQLALQTKTLRYNNLFGLTLTGLERHWDDSRVDVARGDDSFAITTKNVSSFLLDRESATKVTIDGAAVSSDTVSEDDMLAYRKENGVWRNVTERKLLDSLAGRKSPSLQGPIDDLYSAPFVVVLPEATPAPTPLDRWVDFESQHFLERWAQLMRADAVHKQAAEVDDDDIAGRSLVLWGTPKSNPLIAKVLDKLPIRWTDKIIGIGDLEFDATKVVPVLIYPSPLDTKEYELYMMNYIAINSGLTFREGSDHTNSQQNPKLPDWAFVDITQPPTDMLPGRIVAAGFFDEAWKYDPTRTYIPAAVK